MHGNVLYKTILSQNYLSNAYWDVRTYLSQDDNTIYLLGLATQSLASHKRSTFELSMC